MIVRNGMTNRCNKKNTRLLKKLFVSNAMPMDTIFWIADYLMSAGKKILLALRVQRCPNKNYFLDTRCI